MANPAKINAVGKVLFEVDLKHLMMELGNKLVTDHGYDPARTGKVTAGCNANHSVMECINLLTVALNGDPTARSALYEMGVAFPVHANSVDCDCCF